MFGSSSQERNGAASPAGEEGKTAPLSNKANMLWNSAGSLTYLACQWLMTVVVVRLSDGYDEAGLLSLAMSVVGIFGTFANYKMGTFQISDINHENTLGEYLGFRIFTLSFSFVACIVYAFFTCAPYAIATVALFYVYKAMGLVMDVLHGTNQQHRRMDYSGRSFMLQGVTMLSSFVAVFGLTQNLNLAIVAMTILAALVMLLYDVPRTARFETVRVSLSRKKALYFLKVSFPAVVASLAASAIFTVPKQYLALEFGEAALGIYSSVAAPALIVQMGATYLYNPLLDLFPRHYFAGDKRGFARLLVRTVLSIILVAIACAVLLQFIGSWVLALLLGESIVPYVYLLQPVLLSTMLTAFLWFFGDLLITLRNFKAYFVANVAALIAVIPLSFVCVNTWDMNGVSFAGAGACLIGVLMLLGCVIKMLGKCPEPRGRREDPEAAA